MEFQGVYGVRLAGIGMVEEGGTVEWVRLEAMDCGSEWDYRVEVYGIL